MTKFQSISTVPDAPRKNNATPFPVAKEDALEDREILAAVFSGVMQKQDALTAREGWSPKPAQEASKGLKAREVRDDARKPAGRSEREIAPRKTRGAHDGGKARNGVDNAASASRRNDGDEKSEASVRTERTRGADNKKEHRENRRESVDATKPAESGKEMDAAEVATQEVERESTGAVQVFADDQTADVLSDFALENAGETRISDKEINADQNVAGLVGNEGPQGQAADWNQKAPELDASERWLHVYGGKITRDAKPDPISRIVDYVLRHITKKNGIRQEQELVDARRLESARSAGADADQIIVTEDAEIKAETSNRGQRAQLRLEHMLNARSAGRYAQAASFERNAQAAEQINVKSNTSGGARGDLDASVNDEGRDQFQRGSEQGGKGDGEQLQFSLKSEGFGRARGTQKVSAAAKALLNQANQTLMQQSKEGEVKLTRRLSIVLPSPKGGDIRLVITPGSKGHQVLFLGGNAATTAALQRVMPEIFDAVAKLPISVADIKVMADEAKKLSSGSFNLNDGNLESQDDLDRRKRVQRRKGAQK